MKKVWTWLPAAALIWSVFIFFRYVNAHPGYAIVFRLLDTAASPLLVLILLALIAWGSGDLILKRCCPGAIPLDFSFCVASALGFMILSIGTTGLAFLGFLSKTSLLILIAALSIVGFKPVLGAIHSLWSERHKLWNIFADPSFLVLFAFIIINMLFALAPPFGLDEQQYHLAGPRLYLQHGGYYRITNIGSQVNYPQNCDMLYTLSLGLHGHILAKLVNFYFGIMALFLIKPMAKRITGHSKGFLPHLIFYGSWMLWYVSTRANVELAQTFYDSMALVLLLTSLFTQSGREEDRRVLFILSIICAGFSMGIKYTAVFTLASLSLIIILDGFFRKSGVIKTARRLFLFCLPAFLLSAPWLIKNTLYHGEPLYPHRIAHLFQMVINRPGVVTENESVSTHQNYMSLRHHLVRQGVYPGRKIPDWFLIPWNATIHGEWGSQVFDGILSPFYLIFLPVLLFIRKKKWETLYCMAYVGLFVLFWMFLQPISRYLTPIMPVMAILAASAVKHLDDAPDTISRLFAKAISWIIAALIGIMLIHLMLILLVLNPVSHLFGLETQNQFLKRANAGGFQDVAVFVNENLPEGSRIYLLWEKRGYYLSADYFEDASGNLHANLMSKHQDPEKVAQELKGEKWNFTHILCDIYIPLHWFGSSYSEERKKSDLSAMGRREYEFLELMAKDHLKLLKESGSIRLYEIR